MNVFARMNLVVCYSLSCYFLFELPAVSFLESDLLFILTSISFFKTFVAFTFCLTLLTPIPDKEKKIKLYFYFHTSLWCLKRFYEGLKGFHKIFWGTAKKCKNKFSEINLCMTYYVYSNFVTWNLCGLPLLIANSMSWKFLLSCYGTKYS